MAKHLSAMWPLDESLHRELSPPSGAQEKPKMHVSNVNSSNIGRPCFQTKQQNRMNHMRSPVHSAQKQSHLHVYESDIVWKTTEILSKAVSPPQSSTGLQYSYK